MEEKTTTVSIWIIVLIVVIAVCVICAALFVFCVPARNMAKSWFAWLKNQMTENK